MAKKAFCVGINDYPYPGYDLYGCVNDAYAWAELLVDHYDFPRSNVKIITNSEATRQNVLNGIKDLLTGASPDDVLVFANASHGSYVYDTSGDEEQFDEIICPYNTKEGEIKDDELREFFSGLATGVKLTVISDSCFSGTVTRRIPGVDRRFRFLDPNLLGYKIISNLLRVIRKKSEKYPESDMNEILLSGCKAQEYAHDDKFGGKYHGAMTYFALQTIQNANYKITYDELVKQINQKLEKSGYLQHPQLEGKKENKERQIFT
jgi:hypothetical protein